MKYIKDKFLLVGLFLWIIATSSYFLFNSMGFELSPISEGGLNSLLTIYIPVVLLSVFLLLYLTRKRERVDWVELYAVDEESAKKEAWLCLIYLIITQLILGAEFNMGLHFPGTDIYSSGSHSKQDVLVWLITYTIIYTLIPLLWLQRKGLSIGKLFTAFKWKRDIWIIVSYWTLDFFGPIITESADFIGGISASQYAIGVPAGILVNSLGAGLPVLVMMHMIFIPRIAVIFKHKITVILIGGLFYSVFSLFDQGVDYSNLSIGLTSFTYIVMTQTLVGMGKATFTVVTGNPFIHFITLHIISARVPLDTRMYIDIFKFK